MPQITVHEIFSVTVQIDEGGQEPRRVRPHTVGFSDWNEAADAIGRALKTLPHGVTTVMVSRDRVDEFDESEDENLKDWPAERHLVTGPWTSEDL